MGITEKKMETTTYSLLGLYGDNGKEKRNYYSIMRYKHRLPTFLGGLHLAASAFGLANNRVRGDRYRFQGSSVIARGLKV